MSAEQIREIEADIKEAKKVIELGETVARLKSNRDFRKLILEGYLRDEAIRLVHVKSDINLQDAENQRKIIRDIDAISSLADYFRTVEFNGRQAKDKLGDAEAAIEELSREELTHG